MAFQSSTGLCAVVLTSLAGTSRIAFSALLLLLLLLLGHRHVRFDRLHDDLAHMDLAILNVFLVNDDINDRTHGCATADSLTRKTRVAEGAFGDTADLILAILHNSTVVGTTRVLFPAL